MRTELLSMAQVRRKTFLTRPVLKQGILDNKFPGPVPVDLGGRLVMFWRVTDVDAWLKNPAPVES